MACDALAARRRGGTDTAMSECADPGHKSVARIVGYALTLGDFEDWAGAAAVLEARLNPKERAALAWAALRSLDDEDAEAVAWHYFGGAGMPAPALFDAKDEAALWAAAAAPRELRAYAGAAFKEMARADRAAFLDWAGRAP